MAYTSTRNWTGYPNFVTYSTAADLFSSALSSIESDLRASFTSYATTVSSQSHHSINSSAVQKLFNLQTDIIFGTSDQPSTVPLAELLWAPSANLIAAAHWNLLPFSRGSIHISSTDPEIQPNIDPKYFQLPIDTTFQVAASKGMRKLFATPPLSDFVTAEVAPGFDAVPENATDDQYATWIKNTFASNSHPIATCAMMSRELGGVVDGNLRVYGTENVRVVDASVIPMQVSGHLSSTVYAIAEKAAELIMGDYKVDEL
jgi:choline dehydrogenase-like flavoprotein